MKKKFIIQARQTGKTEDALEQFKKSPEDTLFMYHDNYKKTFFERRLGFSSENLVSYKNIDWIRGKSHIKHVIFDEYDFFKNKSKIHKVLSPIKLESMTAYSTMNMQYHRDLYDIVRNNKMKLSIEELMDKIQDSGRFLTKKNKVEIKNLYWGFLTDLDTEILIGPPCPNAEFEKILKRKEYEVEYLNVWLV